MGCIYYVLEISKWLPVGVTSAIYIWTWYAYTFPLIIYSMETSAQQVLYAIIFHMLYILSTWSYLQTVFTEQEKIPTKYFLTSEFIADMKNATSQQQRDQILAYFAKRNELPLYCRTYTGGIRFCEKCNLIKPDRCHHCSVCRVCVLKMDHHCPWINNCVSFTNYKFFVLFLGYTFSLCVFVTITTFPNFLRFWLPTQPSLNATSFQKNHSYSQSSNTQEPSFGIKFNILFLFFVSAMLSIGIVFLFFYHIYLLFRNRTTLEAFRPPLMYYGHDRNAFDLGRESNLEQLFGESRLLWLVPIYTTKGSGLNYDLRPRLTYDLEARQELMTQGPNCRALTSPVARQDDGSEL